METKIKSDIESDITVKVEQNSTKSRNYNNTNRSENKKYICKRLKENN